MSEHSSIVESTDEGDLGRHLGQFLGQLAQSGYAAKSLRDKQRLVAHFIRWAHAEGLTTSDLDEARVDEFLRNPAQCRYGHRTALEQFLKHLHAAAVAPPRLSERSPAEVLIQEYLHHLRDVRGLSAHSLAAYATFVRAFVAAQGLPERGLVMDASGVRHHMLSRSRDYSVSSVRLQASALRSFLRFCFTEGITARDWSPAVPPVGRWQAGTIAPYLTGEDVEKVIVAADRSTTRGRRDFAILLLLARLGLRASEIINLELDDIRWTAAEIVVRGKGRLQDRLPLLADVGEALAIYVRTARGQSHSRRVFLRLIAPCVGLNQPADVSKIAREALQRASLLPAGRVGAHIFRHSLASRMIRRGATLPEISQVLRHRSIRTTELYAKVDLEGLRGLALPWPGR